jgi:hypothetical protein
VLDDGARKYVWGADGLEATTSMGVAHENGDVEQSHFRFKEAVGHALPVRGSREFANRATSTRFLLQPVKQRNSTRQVRWAEEHAVLQQPTPTTRRQSPGKRDG